VPNLANRQEAFSEELREFSIRGPFGGLQSEVDPDLLEKYGFRDTENMIFRQGRASVRPGFTPQEPLPAPSDEAIIGIADFFTEDEERVQTVLTATRLLQFLNGLWVDIPAVTPFTGTDDDFWSWTVVNNLLLFSNNVDPVYAWDGISGTTDVVSVDAVAAKFLMELNTHLVVGNVFDAATRFSQRVRWTVAGDPTDWTSFGAGTNDILNNLGPITGLVKLYQTGYVFHQWGITQMIPTGIALAPFRFVPMTSKARGNICPYSLATSGEEIAAYVGKDNVYAFNGSASEPIGDMPIDGRRRLGARGAIFADLFAGDVQHTIGYISENVNGRNYNAYWLVIPNVAVWVYNFDESNWARLTYEEWITSIGTFFAASVIRIIDLVGTIFDQNWTADSLGAANPFDAMLLGFEDGTPALVDFTNYSEQSWSLEGTFVFDDPRHTKAVKKFRVLVYDAGEVTYTLTLSNQDGQTESQTVTLGSGSGQVLSRVLPFNISGLRLNWNVSGDAGEPGHFIEFTPIYAVGGEQRGGAVDA
jgi:hypothetical protein